MQSSKYGLKIVLLFTFCFLTVVNSQGQQKSSMAKTKSDAGKPCRFSNPVAVGQDPWVTRKEGYYYFIETKKGGLYVSKTKDLTRIKDQAKLVWQQPGEGWNSDNLWAPELHYLEGRWYIYYTAGKSGPPFIYQRSGVLESKTQDPRGEYVDRGMLYTGDAIGDPATNIWSIDLTPLKIGDRLYAVWSGWEKNRDTDKTPQHLYIARMENPWTISSNRVKISSPVESWEKGSELAINEGPQILKHGRKIFIIYSASESWLPAYNLGQLSLRNRKADPMDAANWIKKGPVFKGSDKVYGVGHASFTTSPDGTEDWIVYHTKASPEPGWDRRIHMQPFGWKSGGVPDFAKPVALAESLAKPAGSCRGEEE